MSWIQTWSGKKFDLLAPDSSMVCIEDIAHALSNLCRFTGHCSEFYSVAQHSLLVMKNVPNELKLQALLHDATEAYVQDISTPLKPLLTNYRQIEHNIWLAMCDKFNLPADLDETVKLHDSLALVTERRDLLGTGPDLKWDDKHESLTRCAYSSRIVPIQPKQAEMLFLHAYRTLT